MIIRMVLAMLVGAMLGFERERRGRAAGLRTTILVCMSSCIAMILSESFYISSLSPEAAKILGSAGRPDPMRLAAGVMSGMGVLGAGVIIKESSYVIRGVTTAATLWCASVLGIALGCGAIKLGMASALFVFFILYLLPLIESNIQDDRYSEFTVVFDKSVITVKTIQEMLGEFPVGIRGLEYRSDHAGGKCTAVIRLKYKRKYMFEFPTVIPDRISGADGVIESHWHD